MSMIKHLALALTLFALLHVAWCRVQDAAWLDVTPHGGLSADPALVGTWHAAGAFRIGLIHAGGGPGAGIRLVITHEDAGAPADAPVGAGAPGPTVWHSVPGRAFVAAATGHLVLDEARGMVRVRDHVRGRCRDQHIDGFASSSDDDGGSGVELRGTLDCPFGPLTYRMVLRAEADDVLGFALDVDDARVDRVYLIAGSDPDEHYYGFGAQFGRVDMKGHRLPIVVSEQGVGRGLQPLTLGADLSADGAGGAWHSSYAPVPHYITSRQRSLHLDGHDHAVFDMRRGRATVIELHARRMRGRMFHGAGPLDLIETYTRVIGRMRPLPAWITRGAVLGIQGGTDTVRKRVIQLHALGAPVAAVWLQDWVGQRQTSFGTQLWWSWTLDRARYPGWRALVDELARHDIRVLTYINPYLVDTAARGPEYRNYFAEARDLGYLVMHPAGGPYMLQNTSFSAGLVDLSNPGARAWIKDIIRRELIDGGASGWMADFGEGMPFDGVIHDAGIPAARFHAMYPELWAQVNREAIDEAGRGDDLTFFTRTGYTRSPRHSTLFWLGDQLVTWDAHDGIKTAVRGMLSSGISGFAFNHGDIGGYTTIVTPMRSYRRSTELLMRWTELAAFTPVFRTHEGNRPGDNRQIYSTGDTLAHFARMARVHACWEPYRRQLVTEAATRGWPVVRHPYLHFPEDPVVQAMDYQQLMAGADLMVAPVLDPGVTEVELYVPAGDWIHLWTGQPLGPGRHRVQAPLGRPAVAYRQGSRAGADLGQCLRTYGVQ